MKYSIKILGLFPQIDIIKNKLKKYCDRIEHINTDSEFEYNQLNSELLLDSDILFICSPTFLINDILYNLSKTNEELKKKLIVINTIIPPGTTKKLSEKYNLNVCFSPEFSKTLIGTTTGDCNKLINLYKDIFGMENIIITDSTSAEVIVYSANKINYELNNLLFTIKRNCELFKINYDEIIEAVMLDKNILKLKSQK